MCIASGVWAIARSANSFCVTTNKLGSGLRSRIAVLVTEISVIPSFFSLSRSKDAPIADEPIPASQAKIILLIFPDLLKSALLLVIPLDSAFICSTCACFSSRSSPKDLSRFKMIADKTNETTVATKTPARFAI